jgi:cytochrome P450/NADPH-cytochrome P450 reductase
MNWELVQELFDIPKTARRVPFVELVKQGATVYVCGDGEHMAPQVRDTCVRIYREATGASEADAAAWMDEVERTHGRYVADIFT